MYWIRTRLTHLIVLALTLPIIREDIVTDFATLWLRRQKSVVLPREQFDLARAIAGFTRQKLRRASGGNASKLRDPRKTIRRAVRSFERMLEEAQTDPPAISENLLPRRLRP